MLLSSKILLKEKIDVKQLSDHLQADDSQLYSYILEH